MLCQTLFADQWWLTKQNGGGHQNSVPEVIQYAAAKILKDHVTRRGFRNNRAEAEVEQDHVVADFRVFRGQGKNRTH